MSEDGLWSWDTALSRAVLKGNTVGYDVYIMTQPRSTNAYTDKAAVFYTTAKGGIGTLTYTWQRSADGETWEDIKGAESETKLSLQAKLRWDGNQIRCKVTDESRTTAYSGRGPADRQERRL